MILAIRIFTALLLLAGGVHAQTAPTKVKVVIVALFEPGEDTGDRPGEFQFWVERENLTRTLPFDAGYRNLRTNADGSVLGVVTGPGVTNATSSIMALGMDPRFDFTKTYWIVAGIAGVDPEDATLGSAAWANYVLDGDLVYEITVAEDDLGRVIGKGGRVANAIRTIAKAAAVRIDRRVIVEILD